MHCIWEIIVYCYSGDNPPLHKQATSWKPYVEYTIIMAFQWYTHKQIAAGEGIKGGWVSSSSFL